MLTICGISKWDEGSKTKLRGSSSSSIRLSIWSQLNTVQYVAAFHPLQAHTSRNADYDLISKSGFYASAADKTQTVWWWQCVCMMFLQEHQLNYVGHIIAGVQIRNLSFLYWFTYISSKFLYLTFTWVTLWHFRINADDSLFLPAVLCMSFALTKHTLHTDS